jgi:hypothetical protein
MFGINVDGIVSCNLMYPRREKLTNESGASAPAHAVHFELSTVVFSPRHDPMQVDCTGMPCADDIVFATFIFLTWLYCKTSNCTNDNNDNRTWFSNNINQSSRDKIIMGTMVSIAI